MVPKSDFWGSGPWTNTAVTRPCTGREHGHVLYTSPRHVHSRIRTRPMYTAVYIHGPCAGPVHDRADGRVTCTRLVTAVYVPYTPPSTRPSTSRAHRRRCRWTMSRSVYTTVHTDVYGPCRGRVHGCVHCTAGCVFVYRAVTRRCTVRVR